MLWDDQLDGISNVTRRFTNVASSSGGNDTEAWHSFTPSADIPFLPLNAAGHIASMRFTVNDRLEGQGCWICGPGRRGLLFSLLLLLFFLHRLF